MSDGASLHREDGWRLWAQTAGAAVFHLQRLEVSHIMRSGPCNVCHPSWLDLASIKHKAWLWGCKKYSCVVTHYWDMINAQCQLVFYSLCWFLGQNGCGKCSSGATVGNWKWLGWEATGKNKWGNKWCLLAAHFRGRHRSLFKLCIFFVLAAPPKQPATVSYGSFLIGRKMSDRLC